MATVTLARHSMATRFELVLHGDNPVALRAAGEEALDEIDRLEAQLSLFQPSSEIAHLNARAAREPVRVTPHLFALLQDAARLTRETDGAFDITVAPLIRCWGFQHGTGRWPQPEDLSEARALVGMHLVHLDPRDWTVRFAREGVMLDLGAIGKGYAVERAVELLREAGVASALLHGGTSSVYGLGHPPDAESWQVAIVDPRRIAAAQLPASGRGTDGSETSPQILARVHLRDEALSVSAVWGKFFQAEGRLLGHILDPRTGEPAANAVLAAVASPSATETDALSTALLTLGPEGLARLAGLRPGLRMLVAAEQAGRCAVQAQGISISVT